MLLFFQLDQQQRMDQERPQCIFRGAPKKTGHTSPAAASQTVKQISIFTSLSENSSQLLDRIEEVSYSRSVRTSNAQGLIIPLGFDPQENPCIVLLKKLLHTPSESMDRAELWVQIKSKLYFIRADNNTKLLQIY